MNGLIPQVAHEKILIVDDDIVTRTILQRIITKHNYDVIIQSNGQDALNFLEVHSQQIDLILMDIVMPGISGLETVKKIRYMNIKNYIPIIMVTSETETDVIVEALDSGADDYITKPIQSSEILARIRSMLRIKSMHQQISKIAESLQKELQEASLIQRSMLPKSPLNSDSVHFCWIYKPSHFVGGDLIDYFQIHPTKYIFYVADISGHGLSAAMFSMWVHKILRSEQMIYLLNQNASSEKICDVLDKHLSIADSRYLTSFYGIIDTERKEFSYCRAGHPEPIFLHSDGKLEKLHEGNTPIGMGLGLSFTETTVKYRPNDRLICFSDGITDLSCKAGGFFGDSELIHAVKSSCGMDLNEQLKFIFDSAITGHGTTELNDDIALLGIQLL